MITFKSATVFGIDPSQMVAAASGLFILPFFLFSATSGQIADKFEKSRIIHIIKLAEVGIMCLAAIGFVTQHFELLMIVLFLMGLHSTFFGPIKYGILPQHLTEEQLVGGNALIEAGTFLAILLGTIAGGSLITIDSHGPAIVSFALIVVALFGFIASLRIPKAPAVDKDIVININPLKPTVEIIKFTQKNRSVFLSVLGVSWFWFFGASILSLLPPYCRDVLRTNSSVITLFIAVFSVGIGIGSLLCERLSHGGLELGLVPLGSIGMSLFTFDLFLIGSPDFYLDSMTISQFLSEITGVRILFDLLALAVFSGFFIVPLYTFIQEKSAITHRSRVIAANNIINAFFMVTASLLLMLLFHYKVFISQIFLILAVLNGAVALYIYTLLPEFLIRFLIWTIANLMYRLRVVGIERVPKVGPALLVCNHVSFIDWMIIGAAVKRPVRFIMDHNFAKGWVAKTLLKQAKVILIATKKEDPEMMRLAFEKAAKELSEGEIVCIFPEGKITYDGTLNPFRPGVEILLRQTPVPVIPLALKGMWGSFFSRKGGRAFSKRNNRFWSRIVLEVGELVPPQNASASYLQECVSKMLV